MTKKTVNISEKIVHSIIVGFLLSISIVISGHFIQDDWNAMPDSNSPHYGSYGSSLSWSSYSCLFGTHHLADSKGVTLANMSDSNPKILTSSFEHISLILIIGIIASILIYTLKQVSFKMDKE